MKRSIALGVFDGVHLGHRAVISKTLREGTSAAVFTFREDTLPEKQANALEYIYDDDQRAELISSLGEIEIISYDFRKVRDLDGREFVRDILLPLNAESVVCGSNFRFGKNAAWGTAQLKELCGEYGISVCIAEDIVIDGRTVSSGRIRQLLKDGDIVKANELLGDAYTISGEVVGGAKLGRTIGFPTANQVFGKNMLIPCFGVYASETVVNGELYSSVTDIGVKPTVNYGGAPLAETHILDFSGDIYGCRIKTRLKHFIRREQSFSSLNELQKQLIKDIGTVRSKNVP